MTARFPAVTDYFLLGKVLKSHGTGGQLRLLVEDKYKPYIKAGEFLFFDLDGAKVPYEIIGTDDDAHFVIALSGVDRKEMSDGLSGKECWVPVELVKKHHLKAPAQLRDKWSDYTITDVDTKRSYIILRTEEFPQQLMAVVNVDEAERYIPLNDQLILHIDKETKSIHMQLPEGLLGL